MTKNFYRVMFGGLLFFSLFMLAIPTQRVSADPGDSVNARLEQWFGREQLVYQNQSTRFARAQEIIEKMEGYMEKEKAAGFDTSSLEFALSKYRTATKSCQANLSTAATLIATHAGFDANGKVVDTKTALQTVKQIGQAERQFHLTITQATIDLRIAFRSYHGQNHPRP